MKLIEILTNAYPNEVRILGPARLGHLINAVVEGRPAEEVFAATREGPMEFSLHDVIILLQSAVPIVVPIVKYLQDRSREPRGICSSELLEKFPERTKTGKWLRAEEGRRVLKYLDTKTHHA